MNLGDFIIKEGLEKGLSEDVIGRIIGNAARKLPGNVPEERWQEQVMIWINNAAILNEKNCDEKENTGKVR